MADAILIFKGLNLNLAKAIIQKVVEKKLLKEENVVIDNMKSIEEVFLAFDQPIAQITEAKH